LFPNLFSYKLLKCLCHAGVANQQLSCYQCTNYDENSQCAQGKTGTRCDMRNLFRKFGSYIKAKFLGRPTAMPVCLTAHIQGKFDYFKFIYTYLLFLFMVSVGNQLQTRHACAMVEQNDQLDETTCRSSLYMLGGISGNVQTCELCTTDRCNVHQPRDQQVSRLLEWNPYVRYSSQMREMPLGHVQLDVESMSYKGSASGIHLTLGLLFTILLHFTLV
jgi:hypothetical protein